MLDLETINKKKLKIIKTDLKKDILEDSFENDDIEMSKLTLGLQPIIHQSLEKLVNDLSQNEINDLANSNREDLQRVSAFPDVTEIYSVPYNERLNGEDVFENNVPFEIAKDIKENGKNSEYFSEYFKENDNVKFFINKRDLTMNVLEYTGEEEFTVKRYNEEKNSYNKFLLIECLQETVSKELMLDISEYSDNNYYIKKENVINLLNEYENKKEVLKQEIQELKEEKETPEKIKKEVEINNTFEEIKKDKGLER